MLTVDQALQTILDIVRPMPSEPVALGGALGRTLAESVVSDVDSPPFDKSLMDGYAVRAADVRQPGARVRVVGELTAGDTPSREVAAGEAVRIMTGAPVPPGADVVVRLEDAREQDGFVTFACGPVEAGQNILQRGTAMRKGEVVLTDGTILRAQELGALAELGRSRVTVVRRPRMAVLATGNELVPVDQVPGPGQIRNSNETMLCAQAAQLQCPVLPLGIARDDAAVLEERIRAGLECEVLCLSGGVSMGKLDLVPSVLARCGVREVFHKVNLKPGKPVWFGMLEEHAAGPRYVFGLPGNPVSSMVCFELFVSTALKALMGHRTPRPVPVAARLADDYVQRDDRQTYVPARLEITVAGPRVVPVGWKGSADLRSTVDANSMIEFSPGRRDWGAGEVVPVYAWSGARLETSSPE